LRLTELDPQQELVRAPSRVTDTHRRLSISIRIFCCRRPRVVDRPWHRAICRSDRRSMPKLLAHSPLLYKVFLGDVRTDRAHLTSRAGQDCRRPALLQEMPVRPAWSTSTCRRALTSEWANAAELAVTATPARPYRRRRATHKSPLIRNEVDPGDREVSGVCSVILVLLLKDLCCVIDKLQGLSRATFGKSFESLIVLAIAPDENASISSTSRTRVAESFDMVMPAIPHCASNR
jgi:hypothetical protein